MNDLSAHILALHRQLVSIPSLSGEEDAISDFLFDEAQRSGFKATRLEKNVLMQVGEGPDFVLASHMDTVPPGKEWTRDPHQPEVIDGRVYGLGSNDAKASVAAMMGALHQALVRGIKVRLSVLVAVQEETGGRGTEIAWPAMKAMGIRPRGIIVGEPTELDIATSQKGLMILELHAHGDGGHSAHAASRKARNAIREISRDVLALEDIDLGPEHPHLGTTTCEPTVLSGGEAKNKIPERAQCVLDLRTVPGWTHEQILDQISRRVNGRIEIRSNRLRAFSCSENAPIVKMAQRARPQARCYGSPTMSDLVYFQGEEAIKCGPGSSHRSHQPDEFVKEQEILDGVAFYSRVSELCAQAFGEEAVDVASLG